MVLQGRVIGHGPSGSFGVPGNDACGDFDVTNKVQVHRKRVLNSRPEHVAEVSRTTSQASFRLARLHALLLEKDVASQSHTPLSYDTLWTILQKVMPDDDDTDDESDHDDDTDSMGTIDLGEAAWDEDGELLEASKMVNVFDDDSEGEAEKEGTPKKSSSGHNNLSLTSWGDIARSSQSLSRSDNDDSRSVTRGPTCGRTQDLSKKTNVQSSSSSCTSYSLRINAEPTGLLLDVTSLSVSEKEPSTWRKEPSFSTWNHETRHLGGGKLGPLTPPERKTALNFTSRGSVDTNSVNDAPYSGATTSTLHHESRGQASTGSVPYARDNADSRTFKRPQSIMTLEPTNSDHECFLPNIKRARTSVTTEKGQGGKQGDRGMSLPADSEYHCYIADAMISLVRWEFRAHLLPLH